MEVNQGLLWRQPHLGLPAANAAADLGGLAVSAAELPALP